MGSRKSPLACLVLAGFVALGAAACARKSAGPDIVIDKGASWHDLAAAKEVRRYIYLRTGALSSVERLSSLSEIRRPSVVIAEKGATLLDGLGDADAVSKIAGLGAQDYLLKTVPFLSTKLTLVVGGSGPAVLYGAYQLAEKTGVRFYLDGDVVPDARMAKLRPRSRRDRAAALPHPRHPALPRLPRGAGLVDGQRTTRPSWPSCPSCG